MLNGGTVSIGSSAPVLIHGPDLDGCNLSLVVVGTTPVYYGPSDVTKDTGLKMAASDGFLTLLLGPGESIYGITASGTADVRWLATLNS